MQKREDLFEQTSEAMGYLQSDGRTTVFPIKIFYSLVSPGAVSGELLYTQRSANRLQWVTRDRPFKLRAKSSFASLKSDSAYMIAMTLEQSTRSGRVKNWHGVCELEFEELSISTKIDGAKREKRWMGFSLFGHSDYWPFELQTFHSDGKVEVNSNPQKFRVNSRGSFAVEVRQRYLRSKVDNKTSINTTTAIPTLVVRELAERGLRRKPTDKAFIESSRLLADDFALLVSLLSSNWINWSSYEFRTGTTTRTVIRSISPIKQRTSIEFRPLIDQKSGSDVTQFYRIGLKRMHGLATAGFDLKTALQFYLLGEVELNLETRFPLQFLALEKLKAAYSRQHKLGAILPKKDFKTLNAALVKTIDATLGGGKRSKRITAKLGELNRDSLSVVIAQMFDHYSVEWKDLYPETVNSFEFVQTRNKLFHSDETISAEKLFRESERLRIILQRLFLTLLGSKRRPVTYELQYLTREV